MNKRARFGEEAAVVVSITVAALGAAAHSNAVWPLGFGLVAMWTYGFLRWIKRH